MLAGPAAAQEPVTEIHAGRLIARADRPASGPATLVIRGGKVERVEKGHTTPPAGATLVRPRARRWSTFGR